MVFSNLKVESCNPLNNEDKQRPWSKYSKESSAYIKLNPAAKAPEIKNAKTRKKELNELRKKQKEEKLDSLIGPLKDDEEFKEFLEANNAIKSQNLWHNDIHLNKSDETTKATGVEVSESKDKEDETSEPNKKDKISKKKSDAASI